MSGLCSTDGDDDLRLFNVARYGTLEGEVCDAGLGNDTVTGTRCDEIVDLGGGDDLGRCRAGDDICTGGLGSDRLYGGLGDDTCLGGVGDDTCAGGAGNDRLEGGDGNDRLVAGAGNDILIGGLGHDVMIAGDDSDTFVFNDTLESQSGLLNDIIRRFTIGEDRIDLSAIDADTSTAGDDAFTSIGNAAFTGTAGELREFTTATRTIVAGDVDGDGIADIQIAVAALFDNFLQLAVDF